jgi:T5SS/PEP-CTERM-associated repeat protein
LNREGDIVKQIPCLKKFLFPLFPILAAGLLIASAGYAEITTSGYVSDPSSWGEETIVTIGYSGYWDRWQGALSITNGSTLTNGYAYIGTGSESWRDVTVGAVTVDGAGSSWTNSDGLMVGSYATGTLNIYNGATVAVGGETKVGVSGSINFGDNGGSLTTGSLFAGRSQLSGTGVINTSGIVGDVDITFDEFHGTEQSFSINDVTINLNLDGSGDLGVGYSGGGSLTIKDGVAVTSSNGYLGYLAGAVSTGTVAGAGSSWTISDDLCVGLSGTGTLNITNGGTVTTGNNAYIGAYSNYSSGTVTVAGAGSSWTISDALYVGHLDLSKWAARNTGTLNITNGGTVTTGDFAVIGSSLASGDGVVGSSSSGTVTVDGAGSLWTISGGLRIGTDGDASGMLNITNGGTVRTRSANIASGIESGSGAVTVDGAGSSWTISDDLEMGFCGTGTLNITNGGTVTTGDDAVIGVSYYSGPGSGTVTVDGARSSWTISDDLEVGFYDITGTLNIYNGATVAVGGETKVGVSGSINFGDNGGSLTTGSLFAGRSQLSGTGVINTSGIVGDVDITFDEFHGTEQSFSINDVTINLSLDDSSDLGVGYSGEGSLTIKDGVAVTSSNGYLGYLAGATGTGTVDGAGSSWTINDDLYVGRSGTGTLNITSGGLVSSSSVSVNSSSRATIDVNSSLNVGTENNDWTGTITNNGVISLVAGAGTDSGAYAPMSYGTMGGEGTVQALGGIWDEDAHTITVSEIVTAEGIGDATAFLDLSQYQRALVTDSTTGKSAGAAFIGAADTKNISFTAAAVTDEKLLADLLSDTVCEIFSVWDLSVEDYDDEVYLSLFAESAEGISDLVVWYLVDGDWTKYDVTDLAFDGTYASFTVNELGTYAVSSVPIPGAVWLLASGLISMAGLGRRWSYSVA